jgi:hypothetical protein
MSVKRVQLYNRNFHSSISFILEKLCMSFMRMILSRYLRLAGHVTGTAKESNGQIIVVGKD